MNTLDAPLEALAINHLSYGVLTAINNVWTLIAVFTASVSFWKIRTNSSSTTFLPPPEASISPVTPEGSSVLETVAVKKPESLVVEYVSQGSTKEKFTVYYKGEEEVVEEEEKENGGGDYNKVDGGMWRREDGWETVLRMRTEELGWYLYQDLTVLNGNVVRLWDGSCVRRNDYV